MDFTPIILFTVVVFWFIVFVFSLLFFKSALRVPTEAELELAEEHEHSHDASPAVEKRMRPSVAH